MVIHTQEQHKEHGRRRGPCGGGGHVHTQEQVSNHVTGRSLQEFPGVTLISLDSIHLERGNYIALVILSSKNIQELVSHGSAHGKQKQPNSLSCAAAADLPSF